jgi:hypothetical protein
MPTFSRGLEQSLRRALALANERHHEYATLEHLLLALVDDQDAVDVMRACNVAVDKLRRNLVTYVESELENMVTDGAEDSKPTAGFQRVIQRAVIHVQSSGREEVTGANLLVAIFAERESHAAYFLQEQEMTRYDAVNYISHGIAKRPGMTESRPSRGVDEEVTGHKWSRAYHYNLTPARTNAINVISPYRHHGMWVFDDPRTGLIREPFVAGADTMIDRAVADIPTADRGFNLIFSAFAFPNHQCRLEWRRSGSSGNWYYAPQFDLEGWLSAALFKYFEKAPNELFVEIRGFQESVP